jgi:hypothetical protein
MATPHIFKFYILDKNGNYYYTDAFDKVQTTSTKTALKFTPKGWDAIRMQVSRDAKTFGINTVITTPLSFVRDGAIILRSIYYANGDTNFEAYAKIVIERRNDDNGVSGQIWGYKHYYTALVDFGNENKDQPKDDTNSFTVRLFEKNVQSKLQANEDTEYEIPFDSDSINIEMAGVKFTNTYEWLASNLAATAVLSGGSGQFYLPAMGLRKEDTGYFGDYMQEQGQGQEVFARSTTPSDANKMFYTGLQFTADWEFSANITVNNTGGASDLQMEVAFMVKDFTINTIGRTAIYTTSVLGGIAGSQTFSITASGSRTFNSYPLNHFLSIGLPATSLQTVNVTINSINLKIKYKQALPTTYNNSFKYKDFAKKIIAKASNNEATFNAGFLSFYDTKANLYKYYGNLPHYTHVTSGNALRGFASAKVKSTWGNIIQDIRSRWMCGIDITGDTVRIEQLPYFFNKDSVILEIPSVSKFTKYTANNLIYNDIKCGYRDKNLDMLNARYEINAEQSWKIVIERIKAELNLVSPFDAGVYSNEYLRSNLSGKDTTDNQSDNEVFLIEISDVISGGNQTLLKYSSPDNISGVADSATMYNAGLNPRSFLLRWLPYIKSIMNIDDTAWSSSETVKFQTAVRNALASFLLHGYSNLQNADIYPSSTYQYFAGNRLFKPTFYEFDCEVPFDVLNTILANKYGVIRFKDGNNSYDGFIWDVDINPSVNDKCHMKLLASPNNNQLTLIK